MHRIDGHLLQIKKFGSRLGRVGVGLKALLILLSALLGSISIAAAQGSPEEFFENKVRPLLAERCYACHTNSELGGLRLDSRAALLKGGESGPVIVPGDKTGESLLIRSVLRTDEGLRMPMAGPPLKPSEVEDLRRWVEMGAPFPEGREIPSEASETPGFAISREQRAFWAFRPLQNSALPATKNENWVKRPLDAFILAKLESEGLSSVKQGDKRTLLRRASFALIGLPPTPEEVEEFLADSSEDAFARVVDRLLASPRYGERWGRHWLDIARYGEDDVRGNTKTGYESYSSAFRYRDWVIQAFNEDMPYDRFVKAQLAADLMPDADNEKLFPALGFFGYGPWYYDLFDNPTARANERHDRIDVVTRGLLGITVGCARCHDHKYDPISMDDYHALGGVFANTAYQEYPLAPEDEVVAYKQYEKRVKDQEQLIKDYIGGKGAELGGILARKTARYMLAAWRVLGPEKQDAGRAAEDDSLDCEILGRWVKYLGPVSREHGYLKAWDQLLAEGGSGDEARQVAEKFQHDVLAVIARKKEIDSENELIMAEGRRNRVPAGYLPNGFVHYEGEDYICFGLNLETKSLEREEYVLWKELFTEREREAGQEPQRRSEKRKEPGVLQFKDEHLDRFLNGVWRDHLAEMRAELESLKQAPPPPYPFLQVVKDAEQPVDLRIHLRGDPRSLGDEVPRGFLEILSEGKRLQFQQGSGRLELAEAVARHPLALRVIVNRVWSHHFGAGIVSTPSNFGVLGDRPSHPELLDYLANQFRESGYSIKALHREIMLSATYQLSTDFSEPNFKKDPANRFYWRSNLRRLDAESVRDALLFVAGNLDTTLGGPSSELNDPDNRRRSVYGKISRFKLDSLLTLFDFPDPSSTIDQRNVTHVPLQALFFLNSDFVQRQTESLVEKLSAEAGKDPEARIRLAYKLLYNRAPASGEMALALEFLGSQSDPSGQTAWNLYAQALLGSNEFLFVN